MGLAKSMPSLSKAALTDHITRVVFDVTAMHEFVGCVVSYTTDPAGAALQVRPNLNMADLQEFVQVNSLVAGTGMPMPMLVPTGVEGDKPWLPLLNLTGTQDESCFAKVTALYHTLQEKLKRLSAEIKRKNETERRDYP